MFYATHSVEETRQLGAFLVRQMLPGSVVALEGDLGTGKTELVRGMVAELGGAAVVRSPSFSIVNIYETSRLPVYHFDFYRLSSSCELGEIGFDEYASGDGICLVEWGTMFRELLGGFSSVITMSHGTGSERFFSCTTLHFPATS